MMFHLKNALFLRNTLRTVQNRSWSTMPVHLDAQINKDLENEVYKPKDHPGRNRITNIEIPEKIRDAIKVSMQAINTQIPQLVENGAKLDRYLFGRHVPLEQKEVFLVKKDIEKDVLRSKGVQYVSQLDFGDDEKRGKEALKQEVNRIYYQTNYNWQSIVYDDFKSRSYLLGRADKEYAAICYVFNEIAIRDPKFEPRSFFDFGSGVGTGTWAASEFWKKSLYEYFLVDQSSSMNDLAELILRDGNENKAITLRNVFYRQFLPASDEMKSHIVFSAFTLNELPDLKTRLDTLLTLWKKCDGYMVLIENGSNAGFRLIEEARDFLIQQIKRDKSAYLFAPCPHELSCPRALQSQKTPCNFTTNYRSLDVGKNSIDQKVLFSYVVFKKGSRDDDKTINWPRLVRPTQIRTKHTRCKLCTHWGKLEELIVTKRKHSKFTYRCARKSDWGDRFPIDYIENICHTDSSDDKKP